MRTRTITAFLALFSSIASGAVAPFATEVVEVKKIWDDAAHNAFTDLVWFGEQFYCAFREGRGHVSADGRIRVLRSADADAWTSAALISFQGYDFRDAHLSITPDGRLMLIGGAAPRKQDGESAPTGSFVSFSQDGTTWTEPVIVSQPGRWLWRVTWHEGKAYGVSYTAGGNGGQYLSLLTSTDGVKYEPLVERLFDKGYANETTLRFAPDGTCYALVRRDNSGDAPSSTMLGIACPDYTQWKWHDLGTEFNAFGGPDLLRLPSGLWIAAGRMHQGGAHTALTVLDVENKTMTRLLDLPSGGDTSYPGLLWRNDLLYVSYYSSHQGKTSIYLAKVRFP
ncbi:MAG: sialidase family protein [Sedimentisphaerales bacterium]|nr:sialidase family protein [Sedimentisphaerales bacterium]HNY79609.1 sialidase family protein [Sedimentisphaerales bacterium]HOC65438.1 sialidase family protein [Sedimentisphaerales bacterium]HOH65548.1 sialidase family protein [Sedimentisphaerales bacterium]HQA90149.1 sialidase family protein [Sedimentisphaerales bacterium]